MFFINAILIFFKIYRLQAKNESEIKNKKCLTCDDSI